MAAADCDTKNIQQHMSLLPFAKAGCQYRFTPADWQFIIESLGMSERGKESLASLCDDPDCVRDILDHPKLFEAVTMQRSTAMMSPDLFFFVVVRHTLKRIGVGELEVADYLAVVCAQFGMPRAFSAKGGVEPRSSLYSIDYMEALNQARGAERFFIHVQCANQFMVLTCLYPDFLQRRAERRGAPDVAYYEGVVMSHLHAAGSHALAHEFDLNDVLLRLSDAFPPVRRAMNRTLREYLSLG
jgi:hypothetical protein